MKINTFSYLLLQLFEYFVPLLIIYLSFTSHIFKQSDNYVLSAIIIAAIAMCAMLLACYFLDPALVYIAIQEARNSKVTALSAIKATSHLRPQMYRLKIKVLGQFMSKLIPQPTSAFRYAGRITLWPYYLVDKSMPENEVLEKAYIDSGKDAASLFGKIMIFNRGWWLALEYLNRQKKSLPKL